MPLLREGRAIGCLTILRATTGAFDEQEIALAQTFADQAVIAIENARLFNETQEALARQTATSDVLQVISESPTDVQPVFDIIAERASSLTAARYCLVTRLDGEQLQLVALHGVNEAGSEALRAAWPQRLHDSTSIAARAIRQRDVVNVADLLALPDADYAPALKQACELAGFRSGLSVPMLRDRQVIGAVTVNRAEIGLYADKEVALLRTFARQAVVAVENVRLFNETKEALEQQQAAAEILGVISSSVADTQPVFDKILESGRHLFRSDEMDVLVVDEHGQLQIAAYVGSAHDAVAATFPAPVERTPAGRAIRTRKVVHWPDVIHGDDVPRVVREVSKVAGYQSMAFAPMLWEERGIGAVGVARAKGPFSAKELAMLQTFADQAVIAIQNSRLFRETQEALQQQTATAEVLQVISSSVADSAPVFEKILDSCERLFATDQISMFVVGDDGMVRTAAWRGSIAASVDHSDIKPVEKSMTGWVLRARRALHVPDASAESQGRGRDLDLNRRLIERFGNYSLVYVPMLWEDRGIGSICVMRLPPRPFSDKELSLLQTFADQAVIAIQNARLFKETQEALQRQTASADILRVISSSPTDVQPVFEAIVSTAAQLLACDMAFVQRCDGDSYSPAAGATPAGPIAIPGPSKLPVDTRLNFPSRAIVSKAMLHVPDWSVVDLPEHERGRHEELGINSALYLPLIRGDTCVGVLALACKRARTFSEKEIALAESFRDQAVIAIENVRLFNETKEALEQQTATAEVLQVISSSVADAKPVFEKILDSCERLIPSDGKAVLVVDEQQQVHVGAVRGSAQPQPIHARLPPSDRADGAGTCLRFASTALLPGKRHRRGRSRSRAALRAEDRHRFAGGRADDLGGQAHRLHCGRQGSCLRVLGEGRQPDADLRRPGRDRDPERAPVPARRRKRAPRPRPPTRPRARSWPP